MRLKKEYELHQESLGRKVDENFSGVNWSTPIPYEDKWGNLPQ